MTKSPTITPLTQKQLTNLSKFLSLILRHKPETVNLSLDSEGYVDISQLISNINSQSDYNMGESLRAPLFFSFRRCLLYGIKNYKKECI